MFNKIFLVSKQVNEIVKLFFKVEFKINNKIVILSIIQVGDSKEYDYLSFKSSLSIVEKEIIDRWVMETDFLKLEINKGDNGD